jgi:hypothetical protein
MIPAVLHTMRTSRHHCPVIARDTLIVLVTLCDVLLATSPQLSYTVNERHPTNKRRICRL